MKELNYSFLKEEISKTLKEMKEIVISTSFKDQVTSRTVYCFSDGESLFFITSKAYTKYKQIIKNPKVAVCKEKMQIEGIAEIIGHPSEFEMNIEDEGTKNYISHYSRLKNTVLIKVKPKKITIYKGPGHYYYMLIDEEKAFSKGKDRI